METNRSTAVMAAVVAGAVMASANAHAQTKPLEVWQPPQHEKRDPAKRLPQATRSEPVASPAPQAAGPQQQHASDAARPHAGPPQSYAAAQPARPAHEEGRGGFFLGAYAGKGWVLEDIDQSAFMGSVGYRWQAGPVSLVGIELAGGRLGDTTEGIYRIAAVDFGSIGVNARFNFGRGNPVYGLVRSGYWAAEEDNFGDSVDGAYLGVGFGMDLSRNVSMSLVYTNYVYFDDYYWEGGDFYYDINSADTVMLGVDARF